MTLIFTSNKHSLHFHKFCKTKITANQPRKMNFSQRTQNGAIPRFSCFSLFFFYFFSSLLNPNSATPIPNRRLLEVSLNQTLKLASTTHPQIIAFFHHQQLQFQENMAFNDCLHLFSLTLHDLNQAMDELLIYQPSPELYADLNTLLSAAMTNEQTCLDGFLDSPRMELYINKKLSPVLEMMRDSIALLRELQETSQESSWEYPRRRMAWIMRKKKSGFRIKADLVVAKDGSGDFKSIGEALKMAPIMSSNRYVIKIKAGIYRENVDIPIYKQNIMLIGDGMKSTVITASRSTADGFSTFSSATLSVEGHKFIARDLSIENAASPEKHQAVGVRVSSNAAFYRCNISSYQDTLYAHSHVQVYQKCIIQGTVDFIFGNAAAVFHNCFILARNPLSGQANMITAQGRRDPYHNTGFLINNSVIKASPEFTPEHQRQTYTFLGRPWKNYSRTIVMKSYLGSLIHYQGWAPLDRYSNLDTLEYVECMNYGPGSITKHRVKWGGYKNNCSEDVATKFAMGAFLQGFHNWFKTTAFPLFDQEVSNTT